MTHYGPELTTWRRTVQGGQPADPVALEKPMQRGARQVRNRGLKRVEAIIERQACLATKRQDRD